MFGVVPRVLWERVCAPDELNRVRLNMNCVFIDTGKEKILLETGIGEKWNEKETAMYGIFREKPLAETLFERTGCTPSDITIVVNTHLHFDHAGGNTISSSPPYEGGVAAASADGVVGVVRLEQFYPFPGEKLKQIFASYPNATQIFWTQEEPQNMGGWTFVEPRLRSIKPENVSLRYVGRSASASPATGSYAIHELEQKQIVDESLLGETDEISPASEPEVSERIAPAGA